MAASVGAASRDGRATARLAGWPLAGWCSLAVTMIIGAVLASHGVGEAGLRAAIRASAITSLALFTAAFVASALNRIRPTPFSRWLLSNRRYVGVSFAVSHFIHLGAIIALGYTAADFAVDPATRVGGGLAYVFIAAMAATSFDRTAAWLGPRAWRRLHLTGVWYVWGIFFVSYLPRTIVESWAYAPFVAALVAAAGLRAYVWRARRNLGSA